MGELGKYELLFVYLPACLLFRPRLEILLSSFDCSAIGCTARWEW